MSVTQIAVNDVKSLLDGDGSIQLIDVRTIAEFQQAHVADAKLLPLDQINEELIKGFPIDPNEPIYFICRSGNRSNMAAHQFASLGFEQTFNVAGGMIDWVSQGYEAVQGLNDDDWLKL